MSWTITPQTKVPVDPQFGSVSLLLHGNGANGSTTITDSSSSPKTVTAVGNAQISTAQSKPGFGGASIAFDGSGDRLNLQAADDLNLGTSDFTVEFWVWLDSTANPGRVDNLKTTTLFSTGTSSANDQSLAIYGSTGAPGVGIEIFKAPSTAFSVAASVPTNAWAHIAVARTGTTIYGFVNGTRFTVATTSISLFDSGAPKIGMANTTGFTNDFKGYIDDFRITKGVARYTANFTPPSAPFPDI